MSLNLMMTALAELMVAPMVQMNCQKFPEIIMFIKLRLELCQAQV